MTAVLVAAVATVGALLGGASPADAAVATAAHQVKHHKPAVRCAAPTHNLRHKHHVATYPVGYSYQVWNHAHTTAVTLKCATDGQFELVTGVFVPMHRVKA